MTGAILSIFGLVFLIGSIRADGHHRIIGGSNAVIKDFPFLVSLREKGSHFCGGAIISDRHILTAAHCMESYDYMDNVTIHSGTSRRDKVGTVHKIAAVRIHPEYDGYDIRVFNDISVVTLEDPIVFNKYQHQINLPKHDVEKHEVGYVIGWGRNSRWDRRSSPQQLQKLRVALLPSDTCKPFVPRELRQGQLCSYRSFGTGPCHGDSGGPLVSHDEIVGIVSYVTRGDCAADIPTVFTNVFAYKDFIKSIMNR